MSTQTWELRASIGHFKEFSRVILRRVRVASRLKEQNARDDGIYGVFSRRVFVKVKCKVAIVTGASSGIGLATARLLSRMSAKVALVSRSSRLEELSREMPGSVAIRADLSRESEVEAVVGRVVGEFSGIDILVNCAGRGYDSSVADVDTERARSCIFMIDVFAPVLATKLVVPVMRERGGGAIVNVSSGTALMRQPGQSLYSSLKRALAEVSLVTGMELEGDGIIVTVVYPYVTLTNFERNMVKYDASTGLTGTEKGAGEAPEGLPHPPDSAEYVALKIIEGIESGEAEVFAHDWRRHY